MVLRRLEWGNLELRRDIEYVEHYNDAPLSPPVSLCISLIGSYTHKKINHDLSTSCKPSEERLSIKNSYQSGC